MDETATKTGNSGTLLTLLTHEGSIIGRYKSTGTPTPTFLFTGRELFVHSGEEGVMRTLGPCERPLLMMLQIPRAK